MSTIAAPARRAALGGGIRMALITPPAEKQFLQLSATDRKRVAEALGRAVSGNRCRLVTNLRKLRVYHFDVTETVRVCFRLVGGQACVIHVGTHPEFDAFAAHHNGSLPNTLVPVEESPVMRKQQSNGIPSLKIEANAPTPAVAAGGADVISRAILGLFEDAFAGEKRKFEDDVLALADSLRTEVNDEVKGLKGQLDGQSQQLASVRDALGGHEVRVAARLDRNEAKLVEVERSLRDAGGQRDQRLASLEGGVRGVDRGLAELGREVDRRFTDLGRALAEDGATQLDQLRARSVAEADRLRESLGRQQAQLAEADGAVAACQSDVATLRGMLAESRETVSALSAQVGSLHAALLDLTAAVALEREAQAGRSLKARLTRLASIARSKAAALARPAR